MRESLLIILARLKTNFPIFFNCSFFSLTLKNHASFENMSAIFKPVLTIINGCFVNFGFSKDMAQNKTGKCIIFLSPSWNLGSHFEMVTLPVVVMYFKYKYLQ